MRIHDILNQFVSRNSNRKSITSPFSQGDYTYATDGHRIIRVKRVADISERTEAPSIDNLLKYFEAGVSANSYLSLPEVDFDALIKMRSCPHCHGTKTYSICDDCEGEGVVYLYAKSGLEYECNCQLCNQNGTRAGEKGQACEECDQNGQISQNPPPIVNIGPAMFNAQYIKSISLLEGVQILQPATHVSALYFKFKDGDGLIMPRLS